MTLRMLILSLVTASRVWFSSTAMSHVRASFLVTVSVAFVILIVGPIIASWVGARSATVT